MEQKHATDERWWDETTHLSYFGNKLRAIPQLVKRESTESLTSKKHDCERANTPNERTTKEILWEKLVADIVSSATTSASACTTTI